MLGPGISYCAHILISFYFLDGFFAPDGALGKVPDKDPVENPEEDPTEYYTQRRTTFIGNLILLILLLFLKNLTPAVCDSCGCRTRSGTCNPLTGG